MLPRGCRPERAGRRKGGGRSRPTKNPISPNSVAADGNEGAEAKALGPCGAQDNPQAAAARILALTAVHGARGQLDRYALVTDTPARGVVEAADLLDAVAECLTPVAGFPDAIKGACGGDA